MEERQCEKAIVIGRSGAELAWYYYLLDVVIAARVIATHRPSEVISFV